MKIAIAGTNGLAQFIAHFLSSQTHHPFILLSRNPSQGLIKKGWQVVKVDYNKPSALRYALTGVDTVISTVSGDAELNLIDAAFQVDVRRFVPSEFEGTPSRAPTSEILDRGNMKSLERLQQYQQSGSMSYTVFVCGVFYERFAPGGMAASQIGQGTHISGEGEYLVNIRAKKAQLLSLHGDNRPAWICMTSVQDVARFVVAALDLPVWPVEFRACGDRLTVTDIVAMAENTIGQKFNKTIHTKLTLEDSLAHAKSTGNAALQWRLHHLIATSSGSFDFEDPNLQYLVPVQPQRFQEWLCKIWR